MVFLISGIYAFFPHSGNNGSQEIETAETIESASTRFEEGQTPSYNEEAPESTDAQALNETTESPPDSGDFVNVLSVDGSFIIGLAYNSDDNVTGRRIYDFDQAILRYGTAQKLAAANQILKEQGYLIKIWDAYRPFYAQQTLWDAVQDSRYIAVPNPGNIRGHPLGATVDITLCDLDGNEIEMQSGYDEFSPKAYRDYKRGEEQELLYQIMDGAMTQAGFKGYQYEWWHYADANQNFVAADVDPKQY